MSDAQPCPRCGQAVACGMHDPSGKPCWCTAFPASLPVPAADAGAGCYCADCLRAVIAEQALRQAEKPG
ncbi:cysteine-rich CWC family protein [Massilia sp. W12]|uniref:cysteine-rich CWC family protein n=1 Tax=Massilia sp. W12 TaxID=3126507 RepID=UPI0030CF5854